MRHSTWRSGSPVRMAAALTAAFVVVATLAGCASGGTDSPSGGSKTLTLSTPGPSLGFDPAESQPGYFEQYMQPVYDTLFRLNPKGEPTPNLATKWSYDKSLTSLTIDLRTDVKFSDGSKLDANAVKESLEHTKSGTSTTATQLASVKSIHAASAEEVQITLSAPDPSLLANLGNQAGMIANPAGITAKTLKDTPAGSGPYTLDKAATTAGTTYTYVRNKTYWNTKDFPFDKVVLTVLADPTAVLNALRTKQIQGGTIDGVKDAAVAKASKFNTITWANGDLEALYFYDKNGTIAPQLKDVRVRQAINYALNRAAIVKAEYGTLATPTEQMFAISKDNGIYDPRLDSTYPYDPAKAKKLLADAGYPNGFSITMPDWAAVAPAPLTEINQNLADVGIKVVPDTLPPDKLYASTLQGKYPMGWQPYDDNRPWDLIGYQLRPTSPWNPFHYEDPTVTDLISQIQVATGDKQLALYKELNEYLVKTAWSAPIAAAILTYATTSDVTVTPQAYSKRPPLYNYRPPTLFVRGPRPGGPRRTVEVLPMLWFLFRRVVGAIVLALVVTLLTFLLMSLNEDTVARTIVGTSAPASVVHAKEVELGLDQPVLVRYVEWVVNALHGDFGRSWFTGDAVGVLLQNKAPVTFSLVIAAILLSAVISIALGVFAAVRGGWVDRVLQAVSLLGFALPGFVLALFLALFFAVQLGWFPAVGYVPIAQSPALWLASITLPTLALAAQVIAGTSQQVRGSMVDVLQSDYVRTLRSRGISSASLYLRHALRSASPPAVTVLGLQCIGLIGGTVVVEKVFGLMGLGSAIQGGAGQGDVPIVMGVVAILVLVIVIINLVLDLAYAWLNPKVRAA
ncbi:ABC transporter substrate-binding protein [Microbacterium sp. X-17]|uniref:ABC transporter substrate-binding protein n=1 Tax=Microbacterium sp. X-17 TaxID=3144404 RepID=UPI0031F4E16D